MRVLKQTLEITDEKIYMLPGKNITPLCVKCQNNNLVLYFESDADDEELVEKNIPTPVTICVVGTGHKRNDLSDFNYLGTVIMPYGMVWHCYIKQNIYYDV